MYAGKAFCKIAVIRKIIHAVKAAHNSTHRSVQLKFAHILKQIQYPKLLRGIFTSLRQHFGAHINAYHIIASCGKRLRHSSGTAGKVKHKLGTTVKKSVEAFFYTVRPFFIVYFLIENVVNTGNCRV